MPDEDELFAAVDALVARSKDEVLPPPAERERLRRAAGLTQTQIAKALRVRRETVTGWESGRTDPRPPQRAAYARLLEGLAAQFPAPEQDAPVASATPEAGPQFPAAAPPVPPVPPVPAVPAEADRDADGELLSGEPLPCGLCGRPTPYRGAGRPQHLGGFCRNSPAVPATPAPVPAPGPVANSGNVTPPSPSRAAAITAPATAPAPASVDARFVNGPLTVLDGDGTAYCPGGLLLDCPATTIPALVDWTLAEAGIGAPRLHRSGKDADPLVVLTASAATRFGLPLELEDRRGLRLPEGHPLVKQLAKARWKLTQRGFGPWARIYRPAQAGQRQCVQLAVLPWGALDARAWGSAGELPPDQVARVLGTYAARVLTPRGSTAVSGLELMTALRPPTRAVRDEATGGYVSGPTPGSLTEPVDPAPPEAPDEHPVAIGRAQTDVIDEEAYEWHRDPARLADDERAQPYAVGVDVNTAFLAAASRLTVGLGAPVHVKDPAFDKKTPGCWHVDLSHIATDPRLPSPFTPTGERPTGLAWYATPTVAYAVELGATVEPLEAWIRPDSGPYLDPWHARLRDAYLATMADLGVTKELDEPGFLAAMERHRAADPALAAVLSAVKATVKGGIGKLRERPQGARYRPGERWPALERPTWRPDIRAAVIATARVNMHRKMAKTATVAGLFPLAVLSDCVVYPSAGPSPLHVLPRTAEGKPVPGAFRLGVSPGMVKHEGTQPMAWALELLADGYNPARHIKGGDAVLDEGE